MKNIVLVGMMGSGKTTCARELRARLDLPMADTDALIEARQGRSIPELFAAEGEAYFRRLELELARELGRREGVIIATGGGMVLQPEAMAALRERGVVLFLNRPAEDIFDSVSMAGRPLAQGGKESFLETFRAREAKYRGESHAVVEEFSAPEKTVDAILDILKELGELA